MLAEQWLTGSGSITNRFAVHEVRSYHAMFACTAAGSCASVMPRIVVDLMCHVAPIVEKPLMTVDTCLACRPGFATPAVTEFRDMLLQFSDIKVSGNASE